MPTMVMTGATSGFGAIAARRLAESADARLIVGARRPAPTGESVALDLADLGSVREFAASVRRRLDDAPLDALVLNAGLIRADDTGRTADGFETAFAVNHLAHYLLLRHLLPVLADGATVVLTTSGTHDPANKAGLATPRHADADLLAHPERDPDRGTRPRKAGEHAYTASKLCAVLTARQLSEFRDDTADSAGVRDARSRNVTAIAYDPGQVFGTGLAQDLAFPLRIAWSLLGTRAMRWPMRRLNRDFNSAADAGNALADLVLGLAPSPDGRTYAALRHGTLSWPDPSDLARDGERARTLWHDSAGLVGLSE